MIGQGVSLATVMLWMNSGCNARCVMCEIWKEKVGVVLTSAEILDWARGWEAAGVKLVELCGEPTIHPHFSEICDAIGEAGLKFSILSNGLRLAHWANLIGQRAQSVTVSLDGPPQLHDEIRAVPRAYSRLKQGIEAVRQASSDIPIYGRCVVHQLNYRNMVETVETALELGLTSISLFGLDSETDAFGRTSRDYAEWSASIRPLALERQDMAQLESEIRRLETSHVDDFRSGFIVESPTTLRRCISVWQRKSACGSVECNAPFNSAVIEPNGDVRPCWFLPAYGNVREAGSLEAVLGSPAARQAVDQVNPATNPVCSLCITPRVFAADGSSRSGLPS